ncbi:MAG: hypothetical protein IJP07_04970 [Firmicutes bacterium]|nr:hypothetical protein [Bacillota bacterium]
MKCPLCETEMQPGGLLIDGLLVRWAPMESFQRKGAKRLLLPGCKPLAGETNHLLRQVKLPQAWHCPACKKIIGFFDLATED